MRSFLESDLFKNVTTFLSLIVSIVAIVFSGMSYVNANEAMKLQKENAQKQGDFLVLTRGYVRLLIPGKAGWQPYYREDDQALISVPLEDWAAASARGVTFRMNNDGQQDANFREFFFRTDSGRGVYSDQTELQPKCTNTGVDSWGSCPNVIKAHDGYSVALSLPEDLPAWLSEEKRLKGLEVCALPTTGKAACVELGVVIPSTR
ncbi:hypothetical protein EUA04_07890 [Mycolicibacterium obuense]|uniref:Uncharacterized protein n=1 Tax=Mycolicibacterium obuense TaxID=1807 RepID=A0A4R5X851_9MYCO|nr:hypothetical protein [Mycolicibacterium obuense]TDL09869.1 hypothetical protein EUA04_07890 [Mycolicibacterium obuense]